MDWIDLAENGDRWQTPVNVVMNHRVSIKCWEPVSFSRRALFHGV